MANTDSGLSSCASQLSAAAPTQAAYAGICRTAISCSRLRCIHSDLYYNQRSLQLSLSIGAARLVHATAAGRVDQHPSRRPTFRSSFFTLQLATSITSFLSDMVMCVRSACAADGVELATRRGTTVKTEELQKGSLHGTVGRKLSRNDDAVCLRPWHLTAVDLCWK
jgi:hypothetical protein